MWWMTLCWLFDRGLPGVSAAYADPLERPAAVGFLDHPSLPVRCHYERETDRALCSQTLDWVSEAWAAQVDGLGFRAPLPDRGIGGSDALDLYFTRDAGGAGSAWVDCIDGDPNCTDEDPSNLYTDAASYVVIDPRTRADDLPHFVHHEFNHTLQYATDYAEPFLCLWEATAVLAERVTDPSWTTLPDDLADYQETPWLSAVLQDGYFLWDNFGIWANYEYGAVAWLWWLDHRWGEGDGRLAPRLWALSASGEPGIEPDVLDAWQTISGDWRADLLQFVGERASWGGEQSPDWLDFAASGARAAREASYPGDSEVRFTPEYPPFPLGTTYVDLTVLALETYTFTLDADPTVDWAWVVTLGSEITTAPGDTPLDWIAPADGIATIAVVNLGPPGLDADDPLSPASFTLTISPGAPDPDSGSPDISDSGASEMPNSTDKSATEDGCGCHHRSGSALPLGLLGLLTLRRRHTSSAISSGPNSNGIASVVPR